MIDYATQRPIETGEGKAHVCATAYTKNGAPCGVPTSGMMEPRAVNQFITSLSDVLQEAPDHWQADRIVITVQ